jgi:CBS-domain-containing membrane protein
MTNPHNPCYKQLHELKCADLAIAADKILTVKVDDPLEQVTRALKAKGVLSAPMVDKNGKCVGSIDLQDLVEFLASIVGASVEEETAERNLALRGAGEIVKMSPRDSFAPLDGHDPCSLLVNLFASGVHRCPLTDKENKLTGLVSQLDVVAELAKELREGASKGMGQTAISEFGLGLSAPVTTGSDQLVAHVVQQLAEYQVSALPIVGAEDKLVGNFSVSDLIDVWTDSEGASKLLSMTVVDYLKKYSEASLKPLTAKSSDTLSAVCSLMVEKKVHRLWVVDEHGKVSGVVSMTDVFKAVRDHVDVTEGTSKHHELADSFGSTIKSLATGAGVGVDGDKVVVTKDEYVWTVEHVSKDKIALKTADGKYLTVDNKHTLSLADASSDEANFDVVRSSDTGAVALRDAHAGFLQITGKAVGSHPNKGRPTRKQWFKMTGTFAHH